MTRRSPIRRRRRRNDPRPLLVLLGGTLIIGVLVALAFGSIRAPDGIPGVQYSDYTAVVPDSGNLQAHNEVRIAGVRVGQVSQIEAKGGSATLKLKLDPGTGRIPRDTTASVRGRGLLGARYLELVPGRSSVALRAGGTVKGGADALTYGLPETLDTFDAKTRGGLRATVGGLGEGLLGRGESLGETLGLAPKAGDDFQTLIATVLARPGAAERLAPALRSGMTALSDSNDQIVAALDPVRTGVQPLIDRRDDVQDLLDEAPSTLDEATRGLDAGNPLLRSVTSLSRAASSTLPVAPGALRATTALMRESPRPLRRATALLQTARPAVPDVLKVTSALDPVLPNLNDTVDRARPLVQATGTYRCDLRNFSENWRSVLASGISEVRQRPLGPMNYFRIAALVGTSSVQGINVLPKDPFLKSDPNPAPCKYAKGSTVYDPLAPLGGR